VQAKPARGASLASNDRNLNFPRYRAHVLLVVSLGDDTVALCSPLSDAAANAAPPSSIISVPPLDALLEDSAPLPSRVAVDGFDVWCIIAWLHTMRARNVSLLSLAAQRAESLSPTSPAGLSVERGPIAIGTNPSASWSFGSGSNLAHPIFPAWICWLALDELHGSVTNAALLPSAASVAAFLASVHQPSAFAKAKSKSAQKAPATSSSDISASALLTPAGATAFWTVFQETFYAHCLRMQSGFVAMKRIADAAASSTDPVASFQLLPAPATVLPQKIAGCVAADAAALSNEPFFSRHPQLHALRHLREQGIRIEVPLPTSSKIHAASPPAAGMPGAPNTFPLYLVG
jgi:hypothetical protein